MDKRLVYFSLNFVDGALPWLRFRGPAQTLGWQVEAGNEWTAVVPERVSGADVVIIQRDFPRLEADFSRILEAAASQRIPVILDLDDLLLSLPPDHPDRLDNYYASALLPVWQALYQVDLVTVSTPLLKETLQPCQAAVEVLPNLLDDQLWSAADDGVESSRRDEVGEARVTIAYWGGASHTPDLALVTPALAHTLDRFPGACLYVWGPDLPPILQSHPRVFREPLEIYRYSEYADFVRQQAREKQVDLVIAPLRDNLFNRCKSAIKFLEFSALGLPGVYSRLEPYSNLVEDGVNGLLADAPEAWEVALTRLVEDAGLRHRLGVSARQGVLRDWRMASQAERWAQVYYAAAGRVRLRAPAGGALIEPPPWLLYQLAEQLHQAYCNGKRSVLDGPPDTNPASRLWQVEKALAEAQGKLAEIESSRLWKLVQRWRRLGRG